MKSIKKLWAISAATGLALVTLTAQPAAAAVNTAEGYRVCPAGQTLRIYAVTELSRKMTFYIGSTARYTDSGGYDHYWNSGVRGGDWKITSDGNIRTVSDSCSGATR